MTSPYLSPSFDAGASRLRDEGYKMTPQRRAILELFDHTPAHRTPQDVYTILEGIEPGLSRATVYNNLDVFVQLGLLSRVIAEDGQTYYDPNIDPHFHAACVRCGELFDVDVNPKAVKALLAQASSCGAVKLERAALWFQGECTECGKSLREDEQREDEQI